MTDECRSCKVAADNGYEKCPACDRPLTDAGLRPCPHCGKLGGGEPCSCSSD